MATYDYDALRSLAASAGLSGPDRDIAAAVALAESGGNPQAVSATGDYGLWQINARSWPQFTRAELLTPAGNARAMAIVRRSGRGWGHWTTYRNGSYQKHLRMGSTSSEPDATTNAGGIAGIPGLPDVPLPWELPGEVAGAAGDAASAWVDPLVGGIGTLLVTATLAAAGVALAGFGVTRLVGSSQTFNQATQLAGTAATVATVA